MYEKYVRDSDGRIWMQDKWGDRIYEECYGMISHFMEKEDSEKVKPAQKQIKSKPKKKSTNKILLLLAA